MNSRPLSQLTTRELELLLQSFQNSSADNLAERYRIERVATALGMPPQGTKHEATLSSIVERIECENSMAEFVRRAFPVVEPGTAFIGNWHIDAICNHLDAMYMGTIKNLVINIPPGTMKSLLTSVFFPAWIWTHDPSQCFMYASYDQKLSTRDSLRCRGLIESSWYQSHWGHKFHLTSDQNEKTKFSNSRGGWRIATSTKGRGMGEHPHWLMVDDPNNTGKAQSEADRLHVSEQWWDGAMSSRGRMLEGHHRCVTQQRVHPGDLTGHILKKFGGDPLHLKDPGEWQHLRLPMEYEEELHCETPIFSDPRTEPRELLWPNGFSRELVEAIKLDMTELISAGQLQQRPTVAGGLVFRREWLKVIEPMHDKWLDPVFGESAKRGIKHVEIGAGTT